MRLNKIPLVEKALSQFLNDIRIVRTKHQKSVTVDDYRIRLRKLITNLGDYLAKKKLPTIWPVSLADLQMCVVTESCPLMITPEGQILVPASCPGFLLIEFLSKNMEGNSTLNIEVIDSKSDINLEVIFESAIIIIVSSTLQKQEIRCHRLLLTRKKKIV